MEVPRIRADYDQLAQIATLLRTQAARMRSLHSLVARQVATLEGGDWIGRGATQFYRELNSEVLPAMVRLAAALESASDTTVRISTVMKEAEEQAARIFSATAGAAVALPAAYGAFAAQPDGKPAPAPVSVRGFPPYDELSEAQRSIFENMVDRDVSVTDGREVRTYNGVKSGQLFYENMQNLHPKELANLLNQAAVLESVKFDDGTTALDQIEAVTKIQQDRIYVDLKSPADAGEQGTLVDRINSMSGGHTRDGERFIGPVRTPAHGDYGLTYRENIPEGALQISFDPSDPLKADIDIDLYNPAAGKIWEHAAREVIPNAITGSKTDPYEVRERLLEREDIDLNYGLPEA